MKKTLKHNLWHNRTMFRFTRPLLFLMVTLGCGNVAYAQAVGTVTHLSGVLTVKHVDGSSAVLAVRSPIAQGDTLGHRGEYVHADQIRR
jgi:hypothetical protein